MLRQVLVHSGWQNFDALSLFLSNFPRNAFSSPFFPFHLQRPATCPLSICLLLIFRLNYEEADVMTQLQQYVLIIQESVLKHEVFSPCCDFPQIFFLAKGHGVALDLR